MFLKVNIKLFSVLEPKQKIRIGYFGFFLIIIMFLETFSFGMFYPFLQSITSNSLNKDFSTFIDLFRNKLNINLSVELTALLIFTFSIIIKNFFLLFFEFWSMTLLRDLRINFKSKILKNHFHDDYEKISNIKTSVYMRDFNGTVDTFIRSLQSTMLLIIELGVFLGLVSLLIFIQSKETIYFVLILGSTGIIFALIVNKILKKYGARNLHLQERSMNKLLDILNSTKEIIMSEKSHIFTKQFVKFQFEDLTIKRTVSMIDKLPKFLFEIIIIVGFTIYFFLLSLNGHDINNFIPEIGIFFLAIVRIIPAILRILAHANKLKHAEIAAIKISNDIKNFNNLFLKKKSLINLEFNDYLKLKEVSFKYKNRDKIILEKVDFCIYKNDYIGITGESGGGKSTLIDLISGLLIPSDGVIIIDNNKIKKLQSTNWINKIGYLTQKNNLLDETILTNITLEFNKENIDANLINKVIDDTGLRGLISSLPEGINTLIGENGSALSGGERQRIGIARLLYAKKEILIFDECTSNLDNKNKEYFIETINQLKKKKTIIIISHDEDIIQNCNKKYIIKQKKLIKAE